MNKTLLFIIYYVLNLSIAYGDYDVSVSRMNEYYLPDLKNGHVNIIKINYYKSRFYVLPNGNQIRLDSDIDAVNILIEHEVNTFDESLTFISRDLKRLIFSSFQSINDLLLTDETVNDAELSASSRYERYLRKDTISEAEFYQKIANVGGDKGNIINKEANTWEMQFYVTNSRYSMELWNASGTIYPLRLLKFSKEKITLPEEGLFFPEIYK